MKTSMKTVIVLGMLISLLSSSIAGCGKSKEEKGKTEQNQKENTTAAKHEPPEKSTEITNSGSRLIKGTPESSENKQVPKPEKGVHVGLAGEAVKGFYSAVHKKNYPTAMNYLSYALLDILKKHPISVNQGIESTLDALVDRDISDKITITKEESEDTLPDSVIKSLQIAEKGGKVWDVVYKLTFKTPLDKLVGDSESEGWATVLEQEGAYKIIGLGSRVFEKLVAKLCEYNVVDVSQPLSGETGWMSYKFDIVIRNSSSDLVRTDYLLEPHIHAISDERKCERVLEQRQPAGEVLLPGCFTHYVTWISVPERAPEVRFYLVTPDLRCLIIPVQGPFSPLPEFPPKNLNEPVFDKPLVIEKDWEIKFLGLRETHNPEELVLWARVKNLTLSDLNPNSDLCFVLAKRDCTTEFIEFYHTKTIPPMYELMRPFSAKFIEGEKYLLLVGSPNLKYRGGWEKLQELKVWKAYRFEAQPTVSLGAPNVMVTDVNESEYADTFLEPGLGEELRLFVDLTFTIRNNGNLPIYIEKARFFFGKPIREQTIQKWMEPSEKVEVTLKRIKISADDKPIDLLMQVIDPDGKTLCTHFMGQIISRSMRYGRIQKIEFDEFPLVQRYPQSNGYRYSGHITYLKIDEKPATADLLTLALDYLQVDDPNGEEFKYIRIPLKEVKKAEFETITQRELDNWPRRGPAPKIRVKVQYKIGKVETYTLTGWHTILFYEKLPPTPGQKTE